MEISVARECFNQQICTLKESIQVLENVMPFNPQNIDTLIEIELQRIKENCLQMEQEYVEKMLLQNPIMIETRTNNNNNMDQTSSEDEIVDVVTVDALPQKDKNAFLQKQRADACRRSRYNNKVRKAKSKYRHEYMSQKLLQNIKMFDCIQNLMAHAENKLLAQGVTRERLLDLRQRFGVDKAVEDVEKERKTIKIES